MKELEIEELKQLQLDILIQIHNFCICNSINYSLAYGSLIGAIRHKGYIPWDDDIDIMMPRPDYDRFINTFNGSCQYLYVLSPEININYYAPYANVCDKRTLLDEGRNSHRGLQVGVKIDIFPIDGTPEDENTYYKVEKKMTLYNSILNYKRFKLSISHPIACALTLFNRIKYLNHTYAYYQKSIGALRRLYPFETSKYVDQLVFPVYKHTRVLKDAFNNYIDVEFEGHRFRSIESYDDYLHHIYGDYMQLPPESKRTPHHGFKAYWKDD